ncbi:Cyclin-T1-4 like [Actinidia chinensis var. chinensis]|uniref:Cyclin-T1-4 like n=1 Tax=Actinidia chinensis var. chinensis TaxID=1590841 RepID=A0A2R6PZR4_ACTCC|nr:Cyclin-T1-4 like [Actinidia chinensis var. chinensis]
MERILPGNRSQDTNTRETPSVYMLREPHCLTRKWYFSRKEIEDHSPSRNDGIEYEQEAELRKLYCSFLQELGMELNVPQLTIATAMMLCHRFYMRQSHAKNDWQTIAIVSMFLACKAEETPRRLSDVAVVAYKLVYRWDPSASKRIKQRDVYDKQKELILVGERLLLSTVAFDLNIEHPYKPLVAALKRLEIANKELVKVAWNFVNDWLRTTLCLQYKPHYIAAGSIFLAAKLQKVKLPTEKGRVWWMQFDVSPKQLEEIVQQMRGLLEKNQKQSVSPMHKKVTESKSAVAKAMASASQSAIASGSAVSQFMSHGDTVDAVRCVKSTTSNSPQSCIMSSSNIADYTGRGAVVDGGRLVKSAIPSSPQSCIVSSSYVAQDSGHGSTVIDVGLVKSSISKCSENEVSNDICRQTSDCGSATSVVEDCDGGPKAGASDRNSSSRIVSVKGGDSKIDVDRIREALKRKRRDTIVNTNIVKAMDDEIDSEAWIEKELENGIELETVSGNKRRRF